MSHRSNDAGIEGQSGDGKGREESQGKGLIHHASSNLSDNITDIAVHLNSLLQTKEKELKEREADFNRRVHLFEAENPTVGQDNDVIQLNVGGSTNIAVFRRTLTQFEDSMLAAKFSGRWDDTLEKDRDGNFFLDEDPENFLRLISYLRLRSKGANVAIRPPEPTYELCSMMDYYGLLPYVYARKWIGDSDKFDWEDKPHGSVALFTKEAHGVTMSVSVVHEFGQYYSAGSGVTEFTVEFERGTTGAVGWLDLWTDSSGIPYKSNIPNSFSGSSIPNSIYLNIVNRKILGPGSVLEENIRINHTESTTKVICKYTGANNKGEYYIEVVDSSPPGGVVASLEKSRVSGSNSYRVFPMISFCGRVNVSCLKYGIDKFP